MDNTKTTPMEKIPIKKNVPSYRIAGLLGQYWFSFYIKLLAAAAGILLGVLLLAQVIYNLGTVVAGGFQWGTIAKIIIFYAPYGLMIIMPFVWSFGTFVVLRRLLENREILVAMAVGVRPLQLNKTILLVAVVGVLLLLLLKTLLSPWGRYHYRDVQSQTQTTLAESLVDEGQFFGFRGNKNITLFIDKKYFNGLLGGIFIFDASDPQSPKIITAQKGVITDNVISLLQGQEMEVTNDRVGYLQFDGYSFDLSFLFQNNRRISSGERNFFDIWQRMMNNYQNPKDNKSRWRQQLVALLEQVVYCGLGFFLPLIAAQLLWRAPFRRAEGYGLPLVVLAGLTLFFFMFHLWIHGRASRYYQDYWWLMLTPLALEFLVWLLLLSKKKLPLSMCRSPMDAVPTGNREQ